MRRFAPVLSFLLPFCGCLLQAPTSGLRTISDRDLSNRLLLIASSNTQITSIEKTLCLRSPVRLVEPTVLDPLWWFVYQKEGMIIHLGANTEQKPKDASLLNRRPFYYTGYFKLFRREQSMDGCGVAGSTYPLPGHSPIAKTRISAFLLGLDLRDPMSIRGIEIELGLANPSTVSPPAFIDPMWKFFYKDKDTVVVLLGRSLVGSDQLDPVSHRSDFLFTGYWSVRKKEVRQDPNGRGR